MQFVVNDNNVIEREKFYNYILKNYDLKNLIYDVDMIKSKFSFVIDFDNNTFWICNSITCCACAVWNNKIISIKEFKKH